MERCYSLEEPVVRLDSDFGPGWMPFVPTRERLPTPPTAVAQHNKD
jgi:hypothetical protein